MPLPTTGASSETCPGQGKIETLHFLEQQSADEDSEEWSGAAPGHKASYKVRQREANVQALEAARLAGTRGPPWAAGRAWQPWMPTNLSKVVGRAGRYKDQEWIGDLQCDLLPLPRQ